MNVKDGQVIEIAGKKISEWARILDKFRAVKKKASEVVALVKEEYDVPVDWARTITTHYLKHKENTL